MKNCHFAIFTGYHTTNERHKAEVRLSRIPRQETINQIDYNKVNALSIECYKLKKDYEQIAKAFSNILDPMVKAKVPFRTMRNIREGKITPRVVLNQDHLKFIFQVGLIFDIDSDEYE